MHSDHADPELRPQRDPLLFVAPPETASRDCYIRSPAGTRCGECAGCRRYLADHEPVPLPRNERIRVDVHPRDVESVATVARQSVRTFAQTTLHPLEEIFNYRMPEVVLSIAAGYVKQPEDIDTNMIDMPIAVQSQYYLAFTTITCLLTATALMREAGPHG